MKKKARNRTVPFFCFFTSAFFGLAMTALLKGGEAGAGIFEFGDAGIGVLPEG